MLFREIAVIGRDCERGRIEGHFVLLEMLLIQIIPLRNGGRRAYPLK
jgi:hypothetical protein